MRKSSKRDSSRRKRRKKTRSDALEELLEGVIELLRSINQNYIFSETPFFDTEHCDKFDSEGLPEKYSFSERNITDERLQNLFIDIHESESNIRVIVELLGLSKHQINLSVTNKFLIITIIFSTCQIQKKIRLPSFISPEKSRARFNNGVLEITLEKNLSSALPTN